MTEEEKAAAAAAQTLADKVAADKAAAEKALAEKAAADKVAADKAAADKIENDRLAAEKLAMSKLSDSEAALLKENMANKQKLKDAADARAALEEKLKAFEGLDPTKAKELVALQEKTAADKIAADKKALEKAGEFDRLKAMMADEHKKDMTAAQQAIADNKSALDAATKTINDLTVGAAFNTSKFIADELVFPARVAREMYGTHFDIDGGNVIAYDKPKGAEGRTKLVDASGTALDFEAAMTKLVNSAPDKDQLLKSKIKAGAQSRTTNDVQRHQSSQNSGAELTGAARMLAALNGGALKKAK